MAEGMTHPDTILGPPGEFETCPDWVPGLDTALPVCVDDDENKTRPINSITLPIGWQKFET